MKIVHLLPAINKGGTERIVIHLSHEQIRCGHQVKIISFSDLNLYPDITKELDLVVVNDSYINYRLIKGSLHNVQELEDVLNSFKPDIIHSHSYWTDLLVNAIKSFDAKYFSHLHLYYKEHQFQKILTLKALKRFIGQRIVFREYEKRNTQFICVSNDILNFYLKELPGKFKKRITTLQNFLPLQPVNEIKIINPSKPMSLLSVGRLIEVKNHIAIIYMSKTLQEKGIDFHLKIAGDGPLRQKLNELVIRLDLHDHVSLLGNVNDIESLYREADIYLHPAISEPFGLAVLEAMAFALPCIANKNALGLYEVISTLNDGVFVDMNEINSFAETVMGIYQNEKLYSTMSNSSLKRASAFSVIKYWTKLEKLYTSSSI